VTPVDSRLAAGDAADPYAELAPYYDLGMRGFDDDEALYLGFAERTGGRVLELGCGSGRLLAPLTEAGHSVAGLDRSPAMLALARNRLAGPVGLVLGDMARPPLRGGFGLIFVALSSFLHLTSGAQQSACLSAARELLDRDGLLLLDLPGPAASGWEDWSPGVRPLVPVWSARLEDGQQVTKLSTFAADAATQTHHVTEFYDCVAPDGGLRRSVVEYELRFVFPAELELLLAACGLRLIDRYGGYELEPFDAGSARQIAVAARARRR
jgi:SAM-dependent methyltransferase